MKEWYELKSQFEPEGSLRDIYVEDIDESVWNLFINKLRASCYQLIFTHGEEMVSLPESFGEIKKLQETDPTTLGIIVEESIHINCHFFIGSEIELDVSPKEIDRESKFNILVKFLRWLNSSLNKPVKLTHENSQTEVILCLP